MSKEESADDLLGEGTPTKKAPAKKAPAKKAAPAAKKAAPAAKKAAAPAKKAAPAAKKAAAKEPSKKAPITFKEGERDKIREAVKAHFKRSKKPINSRELAEKVGTETRKLRLVLYVMANNEEVTLEAGESKVSGMTVSPG